MRRTIDRNTDLGALLRELRYEAYCKQAEAAAAAGISAPYLSELEHGKCAPSMATLIGLSEALGFEIQLVTRDDGKEAS